MFNIYRSTTEASTPPIFASFKLASFDEIKQLISSSSKSTCQSDQKYRLISNVSFLSRLTERAIVNCFLSHLSAHNLMSKFQFAYRIYHSCETALLVSKMIYLFRLMLVVPLHFFP